MAKKTKFDFPINKLSENRWSPRAFTNKAVEKEKLNSVFEAARWSASAFNAQPWRFLVGYQGDDNYRKIFDSLAEFNQLWAGKAPVLILNCYQIYFSHNKKPNQTAQYDLGQAVAHYSLEAVNQGLYTHQMSGFDVDKANESFGLGKEITAFSVTALGYLGDIKSLPEDMQKMENTERIRMTQAEFLL
ncbi:MAG: nitroreductase family protein [Bacteroidales bacterium]|jgi:nitroreductase|nr:nitroreductase family protein [Bacteroidales bacterium]